VTARDRLVLVAISALAVLAAVWLLLVSPERKQASKLSGEVSAASAQLASVEGEAASARAAQQRYASAYASVVNLGKAVPASEEVPSLMYQLAQASNQRHVQFNSITTGGAGGASSAPASTATTASTAAASAGFTQMPFTFVFAGDFNDLSHLFRQLNAATVRTSSGGLQVSGRLLTLQSVKLEPANKEGASSRQLTGTISATAYVLPASQRLTGGATPSSPATTGATTSAATTSAAGAPSAGSTPTPAATIGAVR
jgi:type II secretion system (T2SS) protein M